MKPEIEAGEFILIKKLNNYNVNDIITYKENENFFITHRIINKSNNYFITKGDNNNLEDGKIENNQIIGKVIFHSKIIGFFIIYILKPLYIFIIILILYNSSKRKVAK